ncbi:MAG: hypothetical protein ABFD94_15655, partial [Armatimonadia bacterium]
HKPIEATQSHVARFWLAPKLPVDSLRSYFAATSSTKAEFAGMFSVRFSNVPFSSPYALQLPSASSIAKRHCGDEEGLLHVLQS